MPTCTPPAVLGDVFQSLDWVERLSDPIVMALAQALGVFQSLDWVERLSDHDNWVQIAADQVFQSLDWVERLSDQQQSDHTVERWRVSIPRLG